jgi:hypothetical protein
MNEKRKDTSDWRLLATAATHIKPAAFDKYFDLKGLLASSEKKDRVAFRKLFTGYYRLGNAGLTDAFKRRYFKLLFACTPVGQEDPYTPLLLDLYHFKTRQDKNTIQASFVSKMVSMQDESRPIWDRYVSHFFGLRVPSVAHPKEVRIASFVTALRQIQEQYEEWAADPRFGGLETVLFRTQPKLRDCHPSRLCDFLVWTVGTLDLT